MPDLIDVLMVDHREVESLFTRLESGAGTPAERRRMTDAVIAELVRHSVAEEIYLYPAARDVLPEGDKLADHEIEEHAEAEQTMKRLESLDPADPAFDVTLVKLITEVRHHIGDEETDLFPKLRQACTPAQLQDLGDKVERAKKVAPTRPHPSAPHTPPANLALTPGTGLVDRIRDAVTGRPTSAGDL